MRFIHTTYPAYRSFSPAACGVARAPWSALEDEIDRLFRSRSGEGGDEAPARFPLTPQEDAANRYLRAELPGVSREDINVEVADGQLTIAASRKTPAVAGATAEAVALRRTVALGDAVEVEKISSSYENGLLTVTLPKRVASLARKIAVS